MIDTAANMVVAAIPVGDGPRGVAITPMPDLPPRNIPTLSEWGLIAMAGVLGIAGLMVMRRRKAAS